MAIVFFRKNSIQLISLIENQSREIFKKKKIFRVKILNVTQFLPSFNSGLPVSDQSKLT